MVSTRGKYYIEEYDKEIKADLHRKTSKHEKGQQTRTKGQWI